MNAPSWWQKEGLDAPCPNWREDTRRCNCQSCRERRSSALPRFNRYSIPPRDGTVQCALCCSWVKPKRAGGPYRREAPAGTAAAMNRHPTPNSAAILVIVGCREDARRAGARPTTFRHATTPEVQFWFPQLGVEALRGRRFDMVVCDPAVPILQHVRDQINACCCYPTTLWIEGKPK